MLFLYLITQNENQSYETFDSAVVVAKSEGDAQIMHPTGFPPTRVAAWEEWTNPENVKVKMIGVAESSLKEGDVICSSYNAG